VPLLVARSWHEALWHEACGRWRTAAVSRGRQTTEPGSRPPPQDLSCIGAHYVPHMSKFAGTAAVEDLAGNVVARLVDVALNDDPTIAPTRRRPRRGTATCGSKQEIS
jgi:hypothetical protein